MFPVVLGTVKLTSFSFIKITEKTFGVQLITDVSLTHFFSVGLNREGEGQIHLGNVSRKYLDLIMDDVESEEAKNCVKDLIIDDWKLNYRHIPDFLIKGQFGLGKMIVYH